MHISASLEVKDISVVQINQSVKKKKNAKIRRNIKDAIRIIATTRNELNDFKKSNYKKFDFKTLKCPDIECHKCIKSLNLCMSQK